MLGNEGDREPQQRIEQARQEGATRLDLKDMKLTELPESIAILDTSTPWAELVYSLAGTWGQDFPSLEEIRAELGEDILRESF